MNNKIDSYFEEEANSMQMKPIFSTDENLNCGIIEYGNKKYLFDFKDRDRIINFNKHFVFMNEKDDYPSYCHNYKRFTYLDFVFKFNPENTYYHFKNKNIYDLRQCNVDTYHFYHKIISEKYTIIEYIPGHYSQFGQDAKIMKNPLWKISENGKEYLLMYCEKNTICKLCPESYNKILDFEINMNNNKKITWFKLQNGYIMGSMKLYIHQIIMNCYGNGKGTQKISVDHINQDPLNNTLENLRIATRKEQEENSKGIKAGTKRERCYNARDLPEGITQQMLKKYVNYAREFYDKEKTKEREFFRVEHPKLDKTWSTTKSMKISVQEKLAQANKVVDDLENNIYPEKDEPTLPKYVSLVIAREKPHLVFEKKVDNKRLNLKMVLPKEYDLQCQLEKLNEKIKEKYEETIFETINT